MTWRIKSLVLYQRDGEDRRQLNFRLHGVNVITGNSQTGKSAVLDILNYVLMSGSCPIPKGIIRQAVSHVGGHFVGAEAEMLVLRPLPTPGSKVSTQAWYALGTDLEFPNEIPDLTANRDVVRDVLSSFTGIAGAPVLSNPKEPWETVLAEASIRHAAPLIMQPQDVIANRHVSVPGLNSENYRRHMLDALPFLLGIEDAEMLRARARLREAKGTLRALKMKGKERKQLRAKSFARGHRLWLEAQATGLLDGPTPESVPELLAVLRNLHVDEAMRFDRATAVPNIGQLETDEAAARKALQEIRKRIRSLHDLERSAEAHRDVISRQINKLSVSELLPTVEETETCPICESGSFDPAQYNEQLEDMLSSLQEVRSVPLRVDAKARKARIRMEEELVPLEEEHEAARNRLREAVAAIEKNANYLAREREMDRLLGRIAEYIRTIDVGGMEGDEEEIDLLVTEIEELQNMLNSLKVRRGKVQDRINEKMTALARRLEVEFQDGNAAISIEDLSIRVQIDPETDEMTSLAEIGSGANWVCYHLAGILALHDHLARNDCPVPRTLLIDQPSQAWFPETLRITDQDGELVPKNEEDTNRVREIYLLLGEMAANNEFSQIIVMDHAKFGHAWFQDMIQYEWRRGEKLVPEHWISEPTPAT
jgi:hypothetical protein